MCIRDRFLDGEVVAVYTLETERLLTDDIGGEHGLDLGDGVSLTLLEVGELGVGVGDQVVEQLVEQRARARGLDLQFLTERIAIAGAHEITQLREDAAPAFAVLVLAVHQDSLHRCSSHAGLGAVDVLFDLQVEAQLDVEPIAFGGPNQSPTARFGAAQNASGFAEEFVVITEWRGDFKAERMAGVLPGCSVEQAVEFVVGPGIPVTHPGLAGEDVVVEQFAEQPPFFVGCLLYTSRCV